MGCKDWHIGDECKATVDMDVDLDIQDPSGKFTERMTVRAGTPGVVRVIEAEAHAIHVAFEGVTETARLDEASMGNLERR